MCNALPLNDFQFGPVTCWAHDARAAIKRLDLVGDFTPARRISSDIGQEQERMMCTRRYTSKLPLHSGLVEVQPVMGWSIACIHDLPLGESVVAGIQEIDLCSGSRGLKHAIDHLGMVFVRDPVSLPDLGPNHVRCVAAYVE